MSSLNDGELWGTVPIIPSFHSHDEWVRKWMQCLSTRGSDCHSMKSLLVITAYMLPYYCQQSRHNRVWMVDVLTPVWDHWRFYNPLAALCNCFAKSNPPSEVQIEWGRGSVFSAVGSQQGRKKSGLLSKIIMQTCPRNVYYFLECVPAEL